MTRRLVFRYGFLLLSVLLLFSCAFLAIVNRVEAFPQVQYVPPATLTVKMFALDPETYEILGPCQFNDVRHGCGDNVHPFPNSTNDLIVNLEDEYLPNVVPEEMLSNGKQQALQAQAIVARTYALHFDRFGSATWYLDNTNRRQVFVPYSLKRTTSTDQAISDTRGIYMICGGNCQVAYQGVPVFSEYSADHQGLFTVASADTGREPYLARIYDSVHSGTEGHGRGMSQSGARNWAAGVESGGEGRPPWDYRRILAHYYTGVAFQGLGYTVPYTYRFNVLEFGGQDGRRDNPLVLRSGKTYHGNPYPRRFQMIIQNTGGNTWHLECDSSNYSAALGLHWYDINFTPILFEGSRTGLCPPGGEVLQLKPGKEFPSQENSNQQMYAYIVVNVPPGEYWLGLDVEFRAPNATIWGSRLMPSGGYAPEWPTQNIRVTVIDPKPATPEPGIDSGHIPEHWNKRGDFRMSWAEVDDPLLDHYQVCWDKRNSDDDDCQDLGAPEFVRAFSSGIYNFEVSAVASDGERSDIAPVDDIRIDVVSPTVALEPLPARVQASDYRLEWRSQDSGGSGLAEQEMRYQINNDGNWRNVPAVSNDVNMRAIRFYFPEGKHGDVYEFCLTATDGAGNRSASSCGATVFNPDPELRVEPLTLTRLGIYSDTTPSTRALQIENDGGMTLTWAATTPFTLAALSAISGIAPSTVVVTLTQPVLSGTAHFPLTYTGFITVTGSPSNTHNSPQRVEVEVRVVDRLYHTCLPLVIK